MQRIKCEPKGHLNDRVTDLRTLWRPYLLFLRCLGVVNCRPDFTSNPWKDPWTLVSLACLLNIWIVLLIRLEIINLANASTKGELANALICLVAVSAEGIGFTALFVTSVCGNGFRNVFLMWSQLQLKPCSLHRLESRVRMASWGLLVIFLILSVTQITASSVILYEKNMLTTRVTVRQLSWYFRMFNLFADVHLLGFISLVCVTLWLLFDEVNSVIDTECIAVCHDDIKAFSAIFRHAAAIVTTFDTILAFVVGPYLLSYICQVVFNTYLVFGDQSSGFDSGNKYWMVESVVVLLIVFLLPALVSVQVHRPYQVLCRVATEDVPVPVMLLVNGLQNRLSASPIGLSAFHIHVITINLIPSVISIYFTYIFLIIQFKTADVQSEDSSDVIRNKAAFDIFAVD